MKRPSQSAAFAGGQQGVMLIEALVAILIFTLGVVALMGLQANSIAQISAAKYRTDAGYLASQIIGRMWVDQGPPPPAAPGSNLPNYEAVGFQGRADWNQLVAATLPGGLGGIKVTSPTPGAARTLVTVTITWKQPEDNVTHNYVTAANLNPS